MQEIKIIGLNSKIIQIKRANVPIKKDDKDEI